MVTNKEFCEADEEINTGYNSCMSKGEARETLRQIKEVKGAHYWISRREVETAKNVLGVK